MMEAIVYILVQALTKLMRTQQNHISFEANTLMQLLIATILPEQLTKQFFTFVSYLMTCAIKDNFYLLNDSFSIHFNWDLP